MQVVCWMSMDLSMDVFFITVIAWLNAWLHSKIVRLGAVMQRGGQTGWVEGNKAKD